MSLVLSNKQKKEKTEKKGKKERTPEERAKAMEYAKQYRETHTEYLRAKERNHYYKARYGLKPEFVERYGQYSGDVYKIVRAFRQLTQTCPELSPHVLTLLQSDEELGCSPPTSDSDSHSD